MFDPRIYRAAFVPVLLALVIAGFSLRSQPPALSATLAPDAFNGAAAFRELDALATRFPDRATGSRDDRALARYVARALQAAGFRVTTQRFRGETPRGEREIVTVVGKRAGFSRGEVAVVSSRDALSEPGRASLSGTAALLELARVLGGRTLNRSIALVSTSGGLAGGAGAARFARERGGRVDAAIALGDLAGAHPQGPFVLPWSDGLGFAPLRLRGTVEGALGSDAGLRTPQPSLPAQFARLALGLTLGGQGPLAANGLAAVGLSASGERPPPAGEPVSQGTMGSFGHAVLRSITALDGGDPIGSGPQAYLTIGHKAMPGWAMRLLVAALILPALAAAVDGFARARRRGQPVGRWLGWVVALTIPFLLVALLIAALHLTGLMAGALAHPAPAAALDIDAGAIAVLAACAALLALAWVGLRPLLARLLGVGGAGGSAGAAAALAIVLCALAVGMWIANPFAAALLLPALHGWLLVAAPELRLRRGAAIAVALLGLCPFALVLVYEALAFGLGPLRVAWSGVLLLAGGQIGPLGALAASLLLGCFAGAIAAGARGFDAGTDAGELPPASVRGPAGYAGPGSLGGTDSALHR